MGDLSGGSFRLTPCSHHGNVTGMTDKTELTMAELGAAVDRGEREPTEVVGRLRVSVVYPRFLGLDDGGSHVWELADGRWCSAEDPCHAVYKTRTFIPEHYVVKYGTPTPVTR